MAYEYTEYDDILYAQVHCDRRVCHAPGKCEYCDRYSEVQQSRIDNHVEFTGEPLRVGWRPCPADAQRGDSHEGWGGNQPIGGNITPEEKERLRAKQRPSSLILYGDVQSDERFQHWDMTPSDDENHRESFLKKGLVQKILTWFRRA